MTVRVLTGSKQEIAQKVANLDGDVREATVFVEEPSAPGPMNQSVQEFFAEMEPFTTKATDFEDSRGVIYERMEGE